MTRCNCCDLPIESCGKAAEQAERNRQAEWRKIQVKAGAIPAQFSSRCQGCGGWINRGDLIYRCDEDIWVGVECCGPTN